MGADEEDAAVAAAAAEQGGAGEALEEIGEPAEGRGRPGSRAARVAGKLASRNVRTVV